MSGLFRDWSKLEPIAPEYEGVLISWLQQRLGLSPNQPMGL